MIRAYLHLDGFTSLLRFPVISRSCIDGCISFFGGGGGERGNVTIN